MNFKNLAMWAVIVILTIAIFTNYLLTGLSDYFMFIFETVASIR